MNIAEAVALIIVLAMIADGYVKGFVKTLFSIIKIAIGVATGVIISSGIAGKVTEAVKNIMPGVFLVVFGIVFGLLGALERLFNLIDLIPVAKQLNRIIGIAAGAVKGVIIVWVAIWVFGFFADVEWVVKINEMIEKSELLLFIKSCNPLMYLFGK